jgi:hypothetical protein
VGTNFIITLLNFLAAHNATAARTILFDGICLVGQEQSTNGNLFFSIMGAFITQKVQATHNVFAHLLTSIPSHMKKTYMWKMIQS